MVASERYVGNRPFDRQRAFADVSVEGTTRLCTVDAGRHASHGKAMRHSDFCPRPVGDVEPGRLGWFGSTAIRQPWFDLITVGGDLEIRRVYTRPADP